MSVPALRPLPLLPPPPPPTPLTSIPPPPFSTSLISLLFSVHVKHNVYLLPTYLLIYLRTCLPPDPQTLMGRLMAISFGPSSLTISFDVGPTAASSPDPVTQDRYEVMTSDRGGDASSWASRTYTAATVDADDNASSPWDLLHQDAAVRVDERVYITLGCLSPNTTYYVRVQPLVKRDMGVTTANLPPVQGGNATLVSFIVARTLGRGEYWAIQAGLLPPLTSSWHRLSPLVVFTSGAYFLHNGKQ